MELGRTEMEAWKNRIVKLEAWYKTGKTAWQNTYTWPPLVGRNFGMKGLNFGRMKLLAPLQKRPRYANDDDIEISSSSNNMQHFL